MEILLTGATGFIGRSVLTRLLAVGHEVTAVVRSEAAADKVRAAGAQAVVGDLFDSTWVRKQLDVVQGAIHTASGSDADDARMNDSVIDAAIAAFGTSQAPFVLTGGAWTYGTGDGFTEQSVPQPPAITAWRIAGERRLLESGVRASVVQPGVVYGHGEGLPNLLLEGPRDDQGRLRLIGEGDQHWLSVHVDDLADLYLRVLDQAPGGSPYIAVSGDNPTVRALGEAVTGSVDGVVAGSAAEAAERLGEPLAEALLQDQQATGSLARSLGWTPSQPSLVDLMRAGYPKA